MAGKKPLAPEKKKALWELLIRVAISIVSLLTGTQL